VHVPRDVRNHCAISGGMSAAGLSHSQHAAGHANPPLSPLKGSPERVYDAVQRPCLSIPFHR